MFKWKWGQDGFILKEKPCKPFKAYYYGDGFYCNIPYDLHILADYILPAPAVWANLKLAINPDIMDLTGHITSSSPTSSSPSISWQGSMLAAASTQSTRY